MTETRVEHQPAYILQHRQYRETSLLLEVLTEDYGVLGLLAKGVRKPKSKSVGLLLPFRAPLISFTGKADLKLLTSVELQQDTLPLNGLALYCGFYLNELILRFLHKFDPHPDVFNEYRKCCQQLGTVSVVNSDTNTMQSGLTADMQMEAALRIFELNLLHHIGLGFSTTEDAHSNLPIKAMAHYYCQADKGVVEQVDGPVSGKTLLALSQQLLTDPQTLSEAKKLMRGVINFHLQGKPLKSRAILSQVISQF